ncbi:MAG: hypothetical protein R3F59_09495 [Myxococcota bacterium]
MFVAALLAACHREAPAPVVLPPALPEGTVAEIAAERGYTVQEGALVRLDDRDCCEEDAGCWFSNPTAPYLAYALPPAPGQTAPDLGAIDGRSPSWHLGEHEAVVLVGTAPPAVAYWGSGTYVDVRFVLGVPTRPQGAVGPQVNGAGLGVGPGEPFALVTTVDAALEAEVVSWLVADGLPAEHIGLDRVPRDLVRTGTDADADLLAHVIRLAGFADPEAGSRWLGQSGARLLRISAPDPADAIAAHPLAALPDRGSGTNEFGLAVAASALGDAIRARYPDRFALEVQLQPVQVASYACIEQGLCAFDSSDLLYARSLPFRLDDDELVVVYGVDHVASGKAAYHSVAAHELEHLLEVGVVDWRASASPWLDGGGAQGLYAVAFARHCDGVPGVCVEVPGGCPGAELDESLLLASRAYLDPATGTGPLAAELLPDRAIKIFREDLVPGDTAADTGASP